MTLQQIKDYDYSNKSVLIIGQPATGKTWLSNQICNGTHRKVHTDKFIPEGFVGSLYACLDDVMNTVGLTLVEGVGGYRMLRKGSELNTYKPDVVIEIEMSRARREEIYKDERDPEKLKKMESFHKANTKVLNDYFNITPIEQRPVWLYFSNQF